MRIKNSELYHMASGLLFNTGSGAHPTNDISIEFEIRPKFAVLSINTYWTNHNAFFRCVQDLVAIGGAYFKLEHSKIWSNFEFDRITFSGMSAW